MIFPDILILPSETLDASYNKVINEFEKLDLKVYKPDYLNSVVLSQDFSRIFNFYEGELKHTFFVINTIWNDEFISKILNSFIQTDPNSHVHFYSAYPLPDLLRFLSENTTASFLELEAIRKIKDINSLPYNLDHIPDYANFLVSISKKYLNIDLDLPEVGENLKNLEIIIIQNFRNRDDYEDIYEHEINYFPHYFMLLCGLYLSDLMAKNLNGEIFYNQELDIRELGVGFSTKDTEQIDIMAHTIDKTFKFFFHGKNHSIINWYYDVRYALRELAKS